MRFIIKYTFAIFATCLTSAANADFSSAQIAFKSGNWTVLRDVDAMTDSISCTGIYKDDKGIQLTEDALYIRVMGGLESVTLRFGQLPAEPMRLPTDSEKSVDAVTLSGDEFRRVLSSSRLRLQSLTLVRGIAAFDLNIEGIVEAHENIKQGCPALVGSKSQSQKNSLCADSVLTRLRERKVSPDIIEYACSER